MASLVISAMVLHLEDAPARSGSASDHNLWSAARKGACLELLSEYAPHILCTQQGTRSQLEHILHFKPDYEIVSGIEDTTTPTKVMDCAILFNKQKLELSAHGHFWLSDSPSAGGTNSWGSGTCPCATWVSHTFQIKNAQPPGFQIQIINMKLDPSTKLGRQNGALLVWKHVTSLPHNIPVVMCGDFGTVKESVPGNFLLGRNKLLGLGGDMRDAWIGSRRRRNMEVRFVDHNFEEPQSLHSFSNAVRVAFSCVQKSLVDFHVDWMLFRSRNLAASLSEVVTFRHNGQLPSPHFPLYTEFLLPRTVRLVEDRLPHRIAS